MQLGDSLPTDSLVSDSLQTDTVPKKKDGLDAPVTYEANDSIVFTQDGYAHLYGEGKVNYPHQHIELTAEVITMNLDSSTVYAHGVEDSLGVVQGMPVFKDGETPYETNTIRYNFKSKKGLISNVVSQQGEGYVTGNNAKKGAGDELYMKKGRYTTCDNHEHPHFYMQMTYAKVRPKKNVVTGPAYLVVEDVPLPLAVPAISDQMDLKLRGDIFTKGSWALRAESNYVKRYKFSGLFQMDYQVTKTGDKGLSDYLVAKDFKIVWSHRQDPKANPNSTFSASVNFSTSSYERTNINNMYNSQLMSQNTKTSSVSYSRNFFDNLLSISATANIAQTMRDSSISVTLPDLNISLSTVYPFRRKNRVGDEKWYEKINLRYTGRLTNSIQTKDNLLFKSSLTKDWENAMQHNIPISATFTAFDYFNITPSFNYTERWYLRKVSQSWDQDLQEAVEDTTYGFHRVYDYSASVGINTKIYGMYKPMFFPKKEIQIRHVITPSVSFSWSPDFGADRFGYYSSYVQTDEYGMPVDTVRYSYYSDQPFGAPGEGKSGMVTFDLSNNLEMKFRDKNDSIVKRSLIDELGLGISYNFAAKEKPWGDLDFRLRMKLTKNYTLSMSSRFATYAYEFDENGNVYEGNRTEWSYGRFGRWSGYGTSFSWTLNNDSWKKILKLFGKGDDEEEEGNKTEGDETSEEQTEESGNTGTKKKRTEKAAVDEDGYQVFKMPWSINFSTGFNITEDRTKPINRKRMRYPYKFSLNALNINGNIKISNKWSINFNSGYDFNAKEITQTTFNITRDLHCFSMSASVAPFGRWKYYNFTIRANASILQDLKYEQRSQTQSNIQWY